MTSTRLAFAALLALLAGPVLGQEVEYELVNDSGLTLMELYTSVADEGVWGDDLLGANVLAPGGEGTITVAEGRDACEHDFRFVFEDGSERVETVNICDEGSYRLTAD